MLTIVGDVDTRVHPSFAVTLRSCLLLEGLSPVGIETAANGTTVPGARIQKALWRNILPEFTPYEKVEGPGLTARGDLWVVLDNDGGEFESRFVRFAGAFPR